jgi:hypothetical protein
VPQIDNPRSRYQRKRSENPGILLNLCKQGCTSPHPARRSEGPPLTSGRTRHPSPLDRPVQDRHHNPPRRHTDTHALTAPYTTVSPGSESETVEQKLARLEAENAALRAETTKLTTEREILRKAAKYFALHPDRSRSVLVEPKGIPASARIGPDVRIAGCRSRENVRVRDQ